MKFWYVGYFGMKFRYALQYWNTTTFFEQLGEQMDFVCSRHGMSWDVRRMSFQNLLRYCGSFGFQTVQFFDVHDTELHVSTFTGMAEDGWLPSCFAQRSRFDTPWLPLLVITVLVLVPA